MRYFFITVSVCVFGLMSADVVKGNVRQPAATAVAAESVVKEKAATTESIDSGMRRFAIETAIQSFRMANEMYQFEIGTSGAKQLDENVMLLSVDELKAKLDELDVPLMPANIRAELEPKVMRQYDIGHKIGKKGRMNDVALVLQKISIDFEAELKSKAQTEKLTREEYYARMLKLTDEITEAMAKAL